MARPTEYERITSFTDWSADEPNKPHRGQDLDNEFDAVDLALTETQQSLALIQREDGELGNETVGYDQLKEELRDGLPGGGGPGGIGAIGPAGPQIPGPIGTAGPAGSLAPMLLDDGAPDPEIGFEGQYYMDLLSSEIYLKTADEGWLLVGTLPTGGWGITAAEEALGLLSEDLAMIYPPLDVRRYGALPVGEEGADAGANRLAFQTAAQLCTQMGGGTITMGAGLKFEINGTISLGSLTRLDGGWGTLRQTVSNIPCVKLGKDPYNNGIAVDFLWTEYATQQTSAQTNAYGIQLADANTVTWNVSLRHVYNKFGAGVVKLPQLTGCTAFLVKMDHCTADQHASYAFDILGDVNGARTNIELSHCWALNTSGSEIATSRGFRIARIHGLKIDNCGCDHIKLPDPFLIESCQGDIGTLWAESCDFAVSAGPQAYFNFSNSLLNVGTLYADGNNVVLTSSGEFYAIRVQSGARVKVGTFMDLNSTATGAQASKYFSATADASSTLEVERYTASGTTAAVAFVDAAVPPNIKRWNGESRETGVIALTLSDSVNSANTNVVYTKEGNLVHLKFNATTIAYTGTGLMYMSGLPAALQPTRFQSNIIRVRSGVTAESLSDQVGLFELLPNSDTIDIYRDVAGSTTWPAIAGISNATLTYTLK